MSLARLPGMKARASSAWELLRESAREWSKDNAPQLSAAVAYYTIFSLAPALVLAITIAGFVFGEKAARGEIVGTIDDLVGSVAARQIETMINEASRSDGGVMATLLGLGALLFGASGVFYQLSNAMNQIWGVEQEAGGGVRGVVKDRVAAFAVVLSVGFLLLVSLVVSAGLSAAGRLLQERVGGIGPFLPVIDIATSFAVVTVLFAVLYRYLPDTRIEWSSVWAGAAVTSFLFAVGKFGLGMYIGRSSVASTFGAAGSLAVVLIWLYFSAAIFFFGAEIAEVTARKEETKPDVAAAEPDRRPIPPRPRRMRRSGDSRTSAGSFAAGAASGAGVGCLAGVGAVLYALVRGVRRIFR